MGAAGRQFLRRKTQEKPEFSTIEMVNGCMKTLVNRIERDLQGGNWKHCAVYEDELQRIWPLNEENRKAKIAQFREGIRL
jgi:hypothetical protein